MIDLITARLDEKTLFLGTSSVHKNNVIVTFERSFSFIVLKKMLTSIFCDWSLDVSISGV